MQPHTIKQITFSLDDSIGANTTIIIAYHNTPIRVILTSPTGEHYTSTNTDWTEIQQSAQVMKLRIPGEAEVRCFVPCTVMHKANILLPTILVGDKV